jgi:hypothetical protein
LRPWPPWPSPAPAADPILTLQALILLQRLGARQEALTGLDGWIARRARR